VKIIPGCDLHTFGVPVPTLHRSGHRAEHTESSLQPAHLGTRTWEEEGSGAHTWVSIPHGKKLLEAPKSKDSLPGVRRQAEPSLAVSSNFTFKLSLQTSRAIYIATKLWKWPFPQQNI